MLYYIRHDNDLVSGRDSLMVLNNLSVVPSATCCGELIHTFIYLFIYLFVISILKNDGPTHNGIQACLFTIILYIATSMY